MRSKFKRSKYVRLAGTRPSICLAVHQCIFCLVVWFVRLRFVFHCVQLLASWAWINHFIHSFLLFQMDQTIITVLPSRVWNIFCRCNKEWNRIQEQNFIALWANHVLKKARHRIQYDHHSYPYHQVVMKKRDAQVLVDLFCSFEVPSELWVFGSCLK